MKEVFLKVRELLKTLPEIRWIDADKGQLEFYQTRPAVAFPCALIKVEYPKCEDQNSKIQHVNALVTVRLAFDFTGDTSGVTPDAVLEQSLEYMEITENVYKKLQGFGNAQLAPFSRKSQKEENRRDGLKVVVIPFETEFNDKTANT